MSTTPEQRVSPERLELIHDRIVSVSDMHQVVADRRLVPDNDVLDMIADLRGARAESQRLREAVKQLREAADNAAQKIAAAALNFCRSKHEQQEDFEDDLRLCVEVQHKAALSPVLATTAALVEPAEKEPK